MLLFLRTVFRDLLVCEQNHLFPMELGSSVDHIYIKKRRYEKVETLAISVYHDSLRELRLMTSFFLEILLTTA